MGVPRGRGWGPSPPLRSGRRAYRGPLPLAVAAWPGQDNPVNARALLPVDQLAPRLWGPLEPTATVAHARDEPGPPLARWKQDERTPVSPLARAERTPRGRPSGQPASDPGRIATPGGPGVLRQGRHRLTVDSCFGISDLIAHLFQLPGPACGLDHADLGALTTRPLGNGCSSPPGSEREPPQRSDTEAPHGPFSGAVRVGSRPDRRSWRPWRPAAGPSTADRDVSSRPGLGVRPPGPASGVDRANRGD